MDPKLYFLTLFLYSITLQNTQAQNKSLYDFSLLRQQDHIDTLLTIDNEKKDLYQRSKLVRLSEHSTISFGGSWRLQLETFKNQQFVDVDNGKRIWTLNRFLAHSHFKFKNGEIFGEILSSHASGKDNLSPVDREKLDINQLFIKYKLSSKFKVGIGRENLKLGTGRVVDPREGPGVRRSFDMAQVQYQNKGFKALVFFGATGNVKPGIFDNQFLDFNETLSSIYTTTHINEQHALDAYIMYQKDNDVAYSNVAGNERRALLGLRHFGKLGSFNFNNEYFYQFGSISDQKISAWAVAFQFEKQFPIAQNTVAIGVKSNIISGDIDPDDKINNTFDPFYPRGAYFGRVASFTPSNFFDLHPYANMTINKFFFEVDYDVFWRYSVHDGLYNPSVRIEYDDLNDRRFIAHQIGALSGYKPNNFLNLELESNIICPGAFLIDSGRNKTMLHIVLSAEFSF